MNCWEKPLFTMGAPVSLKPTSGWGAVEQQCFKDTRKVSAFPFPLESMLLVTSDLCLQGHFTGCIMRETHGLPLLPSFSFWVHSFLNDLPWTSKYAANNNYDLNAYYLKYSNTLMGTFYLSKGFVIFGIYKALPNGGAAMVTWLGNAAWSSTSATLLSPPIIMFFVGIWALQHSWLAPSAAPSSSSVLYRKST